MFSLHETSRRLPVIKSFTTSAWENPAKQGRNIRYASCRFITNAAFCGCFINNQSIAERQLFFNSRQMYGVREAASKMELTRALGGISLSAELPASITSEQTPAACLPYYFNHTCNTTKTACIYIINEKTVAFIPTQNQITVFDSHYHGTSGAFLAMAPTGAE